MGLCPFFGNFDNKTKAKNLFMKHGTTAQDFVWYNIPKLGKNYQMITKYSRRP
jgi:uncharacterized protein YtpQ (UPF0354 family)